MPANFDTTSLSAGEFKKLFGQVTAAQATKRTRGKRNLTPELMRAQKDIDLLMIGGGKGKVRYTLEDLAKFKKKRDKLVKAHAMDQGQPVDRLMAFSKAEDFESAKKIRRATLSSVKGNMLMYRVTASQKSKYTEHKVMIRLDEWEANLTGNNNYIIAAKKATKGRVSFDCTCGRHQYWYRYIATIGNFAVEPYEHTFPKIRNPDLTGRCCKHVIKALKNIESPAIHKQLAQKMKVQAGTVGFGGLHEKDLYFGKNQKAELEKNRKNTITDDDQANYRKKYREYKADQKSFKKKMKKASVKKETQLKQKALKAKNKAQKTKARFDAVRNQLQGALKTGKAFKIPRADVIKNFAETQKLKLADAQKLAETIK